MVASATSGAHGNSHVTRRVNACTVTHFSIISAVRSGVHQSWRRSFPPPIVGYAACNRSILTAYHTEHASAAASFACVTPTHTNNFNVHASCIAAVGRWLIRHCHDGQGQLHCRRGRHWQGQC